MKIDKKEIKKILLIKPRGIGDVVLSSVVFENLINEFPNAKIDYLTEKPSNFLLEPLSFLNEIIIIKKKKISDRIKLFSKIKRNNYDLVFDFYSTPFTAQITFFSKAKYRVGFPYKGRKYAYNLFGPEERSTHHAALLHNEILKSVDIPVVSNKLQIGFSEEDKLFAEELRNNLKANNQLLIGVSPSGGWQSKKCPKEKFSQLINLTQKKYGCKILVLWGPGDKEDAEFIFENKICDDIILAPPTSITQMASAISICDIFIANDSGPMHISTAVNTPTLSIHGPTNPHLQGPFGDNHSFIRLEELECIECNLLDCPKDQECFKNLPIENFINTVDQLLIKNKLK